MTKDGKLERKDEHPINPVERENRITPHVKLNFLSDVGFYCAFVNTI